MEASSEQVQTNLRPATIYDRVLGTFRHELMIGLAAPGQILSLRKLAKAYGTSAMPIRKALAQLVAANALEVLANRSVRVPLLTRAKLKELFEVRVLVETAAAKAAVLNLCKDLACPDLAARVEKVNDDVLDGIMKRDVIALLTSNKKFHFMIYEASGSGTLMPMIESLWLQIGPPMHAWLRMPDSSWDASRHNGILDALRQMDPGAMEKALSSHIRTTAQELLQLPAFAGP